MNRREFEARLGGLLRAHEALIARENAKELHGNGIFDRYVDPVVTAEHAPVYWRYDLDFQRNPRLIERMGINAAFNAGAIEHDGKILLVLRVEGVDRKSFFAIAESATGIDGFRFWDYPVTMPETVAPSSGDVMSTVGGVVSGLMIVTEMLLVVELPALSSACILIVWRPFGCAAVFRFHTYCGDWSYPM